MVDISVGKQHSGESQQTDRVLLVQTQFLRRAAGGGNPVSQRIWEKTSRQQRRQVPGENGG